MVVNTDLLLSSMLPFTGVDPTVVLTWMILCLLNVVLTWMILCLLDVEPTWMILFTGALMILC
jgi:hypothetical protein